MISWSAVFSGRYDSPWCITQKLAWLNATSPHNILTDIAKRSICSRYTCRSFTDLRWWDDIRADIARDPPGHTASDRLKAARALLVTEEVAHFLKVASTLMSDSLRVCPACVSEGYHSVVHQLAGLQRCPIHRRKIIESCPACRFPLGIYVVGYVCAFGCASCGKTLLQDRGLMPSSAKLRGAELSCIAPVVRWIFRTKPHVSVPWATKACSIVFAHTIARKMQPLGLPAALIHTLAAIEKFPLDPILLGPKVSQLRVIPKAKELPPGSASEPFECAAKVAKRIIFEVEAWIECNELGKHQKCYEIGGFLTWWWSPDSRHIGFHPEICVTAYAFTLWRARAYELVETIALSSYVRGPINLGDGTDLRNCLLSSYHYCLHSLDLLRGLHSQGDGSAVRKVRDFGLLSLLHDPWIQFEDPTSNDEAPRALVRNDLYFAARDAGGEMFCDHFACFDAYMDSARDRFRRIAAY